jgi:SAM-dependent methyltransferase
MEIVDPERFYKLLAEAETAEFSGWDFQWLHNRLNEEPPPWDYERMVRDHFNTADSLLDMGTGGGEFLASLAPLPQDTHATEAYPPNQSLARERLSPLGVKVHYILDEGPLPFENNRFDLVINRHEWYDPVEVYRVLKPEGVFITQQVGGLDNLELHQVLEKSPTFQVSKWSLAHALTQLYETDFAIQQAEKAALKYTFLDIGAVVYYLKAIPWEIEGFSPETDIELLSVLHNIIEQQGQFDTTAHRFLIIARKKEISK